MSEEWFIRKEGNEKKPLSPEYMEWKLYVGGALAGLRIANNETRTEVAKAIGVNRHAVEVYERGAIEIPAYLITNYCHHYNVEPNQIIPYGSKDKSNIVPQEEFDPVFHDLSDEQREDIKTVMDILNENTDGSYALRLRYQLLGILYEYRRLNQADK